MQYTISVQQVHFVSFSLHFGVYYPLLRKIASRTCCHERTERAVAGGGGPGRGAPCSWFSAVQLYIYKTHRLAEWQNLITLS